MNQNIVSVFITILLVLVLSCGSPPESVGA
jgi:hypothetical protein